MTDAMRVAYAACFVLTVVVGLIGWLAGRDPAMLAPILAAVTMAAGIGEASNVGKRATYKPEAAKES